MLFYTEYGFVSLSLILREFPLKKNTQISAHDLCTDNVVRFKRMLLFKTPTFFFCTTSPTMQL